MDTITTSQEDSLQDFLDGNLEGPALQQLKLALAASTAMQQRLEELRHIHEHLKTHTLQSPSAVFVDRVMRNLSRAVVTVQPSPKNGLMLLAGVIIASGMLAIMISAGAFDQIRGLIQIEQIEPLKKYVTPSLPSFSINGKLIMKILIGINLVLAFIVLDRTVLRPYFQRRANSL